MKNKDHDVSMCCTYHSITQMIFSPAHRMVEDLENSPNAVRYITCDKHEHENINIKKCTNVSEFIDGMKFSFSTGSKTQSKRVKPGMSGKIAPVKK